MGLSAMSLGLVSAGIDWVTLTSTNQHTQSRMRNFFQGVAVRDSRLGYVTKKGGAFGFYGQKTRHALLAQKDDRSLLQVSGQEAQQAFRLMRQGDNCTRLDIQVTVRVESGTVGATLARMACQARNAPAVRGIRPKIKTIEGEHGTETAFIGKRASEIYIRLYDKFEESGKEEWKDCIRLEVEVKGKTAQALWAKCATDGMGPGYLLSVLRGLLERRGIDVTWIEWPHTSLALPLKEKTSLERTRAWWAAQVAPSIARDVAEWGYYTALSILFDGCLTEWDRTAIMNAISLVRGN
jgi:hypothetical protein